MGGSGISIKSLDEEIVKISQVGHYYFDSYGICGMLLRLNGCFFEDCVALPDYVLQTRLKLILSLMH